MLHREFLYSPYTTATIVNILYYHGTFVKARKLTLVCYYLNSGLYLDFNSFSINVHSLFQDPTQSTTLHSVVISPGSSLVGQFLGLSLFCMNWKTLLRRTGQISCRPSPKLVLSDVSLMLRLELWVFWKILQSCNALPHHTSYLGVHDIHMTSLVILTFIVRLI